jgi:hypothetical protein
MKVDKTQHPGKYKSKPMVPLATMTGKLQPKTMKLKGIIKIGLYRY